MNDTSQLRAVSSPSATRLRLLRTVGELLLVAFLLTMVSRQFRDHPKWTSKDADNYVSYAKHISTHGNLLPKHHRMPGYPAFLALCYGDSIEDGVPNEEYYFWDVRDESRQVQHALLLAFLTIAWFWARRRVGPAMALVFLGIMALPNNFIYTATVPLPDFLFAVLLLAAMVITHRFLFSLMPCVWRRAVAFLGLLVLLSLAQSLRPNAASFLGIAAAGMLVTFLVRLHIRRDASPHAGTGAVCPRTAILLAGLGAVTVLSFALLDPGRGVRTFMNRYFQERAAIALPLADDSPDEQYLEAEKHRVEGKEGLRSARLRYSGAPYHKMRNAMNPRTWKICLDVGAQRVMAHPWEFLKVSWRQAKRMHHLTAQRFYLARPNLLYHRNAYPPDVHRDKRVGRAFFRYGLYFPSGGSTYDMWREGAWLAVNWLLLLAGMLALHRCHPMGASSTALAILLSIGFLACTNYIDARYLLVYAIPIHLCQAAGVLELASVLGRGRRPNLPELPSESCLVRHLGTPDPNEADTQMEDRKNRMRAMVGTCRARLIALRASISTDRCEEVAATARDFLVDATGVLRLGSGLPETEAQASPDGAVMELPESRLREHLRKLLDKSTAIGDRTARPPRRRELRRLGNSCDRLFRESVAWTTHLLRTSMRTEGDKRRARKLRRVALGGGAVVAALLALGYLLICLPAGRNRLMRYEQRIDHLRSLERALAKYHKDHGKYPPSSADRASGGSRWDGLHSRRGASRQDWIAGLAPKYIESLPRDPRLTDDPSKQYLYRSNGKEYRLIVTNPESYSLARRRNPEMMLPGHRDHRTYGVWSLGAPWQSP